MECLSEKVSGAYRTAPRQSRGAVLDQKRTDGKRSLFRDVRAVARDRDAMKSLGTRVSRFEPRLQSGGRLSASSNEDGRVQTASIRQTVPSAEPEVGKNVSLV